MIILIIAVVVCTLFWLLMEVDEGAIAFLLMISSLFALIGYSIYVCDKNESQFMAECQQDHKRYECEAMFSNGIVLPAKQEAKP